MNFSKINPLKCFAGIMFTNGFYRSLISHPIRDYDNSYENEIFTDKIIRASINGVLHMSWYCPISIYQTIGRLEIKLSGKDPNNYKYFYTEPFSYTTLPNKEITIVSKINN